MGNDFIDMLLIMDEGSSSLDTRVLTHEFGFFIPQKIIDGLLQDLEDVFSVYIGYHVGCLICVVFVCAGWYDNNHFLGVVFCFYADLYCMLGF